jgi:hypothetical protein
MTAAYPTPPSVFVPVARSPSGSTAQTLVLVGLILQIIGAVILLSVVGFLFGFSILHPYAYAWVAVTATVVVGAIVVLMLYLTYAFSYERIQRGEYEAARAPTLVFAILNLITLSLISGILYLVAYVKLGDAVREQQFPYPTYSPGYVFLPPPPAPVPQVACKGCGRVYPVGQFGFCPNCGQKLGS